MRPRPPRPYSADLHHRPPCSPPSCRSPLPPSRAAFTTPVEFVVEVVHRARDLRRIRHEESGGWTGGRVGEDLYWIRRRVSAP